MSADDIKARFLHEIELRAYDDRYVDRNEEREILEIALQLGMGVGPAKAALADVCGRQGYVVESVVLKEVGDRFAAPAARGDKVDRAAFDAAFAAAKVAVGGQKPDRELKKMVLLVLEDAGHARAAGWFGDWFVALKRELGLPT